MWSCREATPERASPEVETAIVAAAVADDAADWLPERPSLRKPLNSCSRNSLFSNHSKIEYSVFVLFGLHLFVGIVFALFVGLSPEEENRKPAGDSAEP